MITIGDVRSLLAEKMTAQVYLKIEDMESKIIEEMASEFRGEHPTMLKMLQDARKEVIHERIVECILPPLLFIYDGENRDNQMRERTLDVKLTTDDVTFDMAVSNIFIYAGLHQSSQESRIQMLDGSYGYYWDRFAKPIITAMREELLNRYERMIDHDNYDVDTHPYVADLD